MKILLISDTHGRADRLTRLLRRHADADLLLFLGDGLDEVDDATQRCRAMCVCVRGNCDSYGVFRGTFAKKTEELPLLGHRLMLTHGDLYQVKYGLDPLIEAARARGADIVLFGHTHQPYEAYLPSETGPLWLFNPGSLGMGGSYGLLTLTERGDVLFSHGTLA